MDSVLVVEDSTLFREFLVGWLQREGFSVILQASSLAEAELHLQTTQLDLVLLDLELPDGDGLELARGITQKRRDTRILVLTAYQQSYPVLKLKRSMVMGVLDKNGTTPEELRHAVQTVGNWRSYFSSRIEQTFRNLVSETSAFYKTLSNREEEILRLFGRGMSNEEVAQTLKLQLSTVQGHRRNIMGKLAIKKSGHLMAWAIRNGMVRNADFHLHKDKAQR